MVEPSHPFQGRQFKCLLGFPGCTAVDQFGLAQPIDRFGQGVSLLSPRLPTEGCMPASVRRSVERVERIEIPRRSDGFKHRSARIACQMGKGAMKAGTIPTGTRVSAITVSRKARVERRVGGVSISGCLPA